MSAHKTSVALAAVTASALIALAVQVSFKINIYSKLGTLEIAARKTGFIKK